MSPIAKMPGVALSNFAVSTGMRFRSGSIEFRNRSELDRQAKKEGTYRIHAPLLLVGAGKRHGFHWPPAPWSAFTLGDVKAIFFSAASSRIAVDAVMPARKPSGGARA